MKKLSSVFYGLAALAGVGGGVYAIVVGKNAHSFWLALLCLCGTAVSVLLFVAIAQILEALDQTTDALYALNSKIAELQADVREGSEPPRQATTPAPTAAAPKASTAPDYFSAQIICPVCKCVQSRYRTSCLSCGRPFVANAEGSATQAE